MPLKSTLLRNYTMGEDILDQATHNMKESIRLHRNFLNKVGGGGGGGR